jgi:hypothetical protein
MSYVSRSLYIESLCPNKSQWNNTRYLAILNLYNINYKLYFLVIFYLKRCSLHMENMLNNEKSMKNPPIPTNCGSKPINFLNPCFIDCSEWWKKSSQTTVPLNSGPLGKLWNSQNINWPISLVHTDQPMNLAGKRQHEQLNSWSSRSSTK